MLWRKQGKHHLNSILKNLTKKMQRISLTYPVEEIYNVNILLKEHSFSCFLRKITIQVKVLHILFAKPNSTFLYLKQ